VLHSHLKGTVLTDSRKIVFSFYHPYIDVFSILKSVWELQLLGKRGYTRKDRRKSGIRYALERETLVVFFQVTKGWANQQEKQACKALLM
jgi:hypothetical protein